MKLTLIALATGSALLFAPVHAGGPVIIEDQTETVAPRKERKLGGLIAVGIGLLIIAAISGSDKPCTVEDPVTPDDGGC